MLVPEVKQSWQGHSMMGHTPASTDWPGQQALNDANHKTPVWKLWKLYGMLASEANNQERMLSPSQVRNTLTA